MFEDNEDFDIGKEFELDYSKSKNANLKEKRNETVRFQPYLTPNTVVRKINSPQVTIRKFPGPAGVLPVRKQAVSITSFLENLNEKDKNEDTVLCSQASSMMFQEATWLEVYKEHKDLINTYNIEWIRDNANLQRLNTIKAPFLAAVIQNIECVEKGTVHVKLKDISGNIDGCMILDLFKQYSESLVTGSVLVLQRFGVLTTGINNHFLTITLKNLVAIYSQNKNNELIVQKLGEITNENKKSNQIIEKVSAVDSVGKENANIWDNLLEEIDTNSFFEDF